MALTFEWDPEKAAENARKHGVTFEEASTVRRGRVRIISARLLTRAERIGYEEKE